MSASVSEYECDCEFDGGLVRVSVRLIVSLSDSECECE